MHRYIYVIEVQKPTGNTRFLKSFSKPLTIDGKEISKSYPFKVKLFDDREETYSYLTELEVVSEDDLLQAYRDLVSTHKISLQFTKDNYVYLIQRDAPCHITDIITHPCPARPHLHSRKWEAIPIYEEKEETGVGPIPIPDPTPDDPYDPAQIPSLFTEDWFNYFIRKTQFLAGFWKCAHSIPYMNLEAFVLTYRAYCASLGDLVPPVTLYHKLQLRDIAPPAQPLEIIRLGTFACPTVDTYNAYVKPTYEATVDTLGDTGLFYSSTTAEDLIKIYQLFMAEIGKWYVKQEVKKKTS